jgi:hypothetical protein
MTTAKALGWTVIALLGCISEHEQSADDAAPAARRLPSRRGYCTLRLDESLRYGNGFAYGEVREVRAVESPLLYFPDECCPAEIERDECDGDFVPAVEVVIDLRARAGAVDGDVLRLRLGATELIRWGSRPRFRDDGTIDRWVSEADDGGLYPGMVVGGVLRSVPGTPFHVPGADGLVSRGDDGAIYSQPPTQPCVLGTPDFDGMPEAEFLAAVLGQFVGQEYLTSDEDAVLAGCFERE